MTRSVENVWSRILAHEGETFHQVRGKAFTYRVNGPVLNPNTTNRNVSRSQLETALALVPLEGPGQINDLQAPSYIYAILMDDRIRGNDW
ncbi:MAG TPA: hypothetical protein VFH62_03915 [Dehalococcoidia bacterium]|jgi:hypothetical protein|nr:hypothetical protein [Dehalococcoidia bacterium]